MKLYISRSKDGTITYFVQKSFRKRRPDGTTFPTSKNVERIGTYQDLKGRGIEDPETWAKQYVRDVTQKEKEERDTL